MKRAFSLVEILIAVAILGILAAVVFPQFQSYSQQAKESAAKDNLRVLRTVIEMYAARHDGVAPGYPNNDPSKTPATYLFVYQVITEHYINTIPSNPFNGSSMFRPISNSAKMPAKATGSVGWTYKAATKEIRLDWPGTDEKGVPYYNY